MQYIINDKYVEFRKALSEGKTVQANVNYWIFPETDVKKWQDIVSQDSFNKYGIENLRIKPEEKYEFKVGDWIRRSGYDINIGQIKEINKDINDEVIGFYTERYFFTIDECEPWKPQENEWCLFKKNDSIYALAQFEAGDIYDSNSIIKSVQLGFDGSPYWDICQPYLGRLPEGFIDEK